MSDYVELLERVTGIKVVAEKYFGKYEGDIAAVVTDGNRFGAVVIGYGSCSGCDALEAAYGDKQAEEEIAWSIRRAILWGSRAELRKSLSDGIYWYGNDEGLQSKLDVLLIGVPA